MPLSLFDLINPAAFPSLWYWVVTALIWSRLSHAPLGVPADLYTQARGESDDEAFVLIKHSVIRHLGMVDRAGVWLTGAWGFALTVLVVLSVIHQLQLAQAVLLIAAPYALAQWMTTRAARRMTEIEPEIETLMAAMRRLRVTLQVIGLAAIFVAALFGMIQNLRAALL